ncbi:MAG TPA: hypothetical protein VNE42_08025 [Acidimicrobiales bacterium]|nr:hypothetical protein [Acidimicrobiales bacterium]
MFHELSFLPSLTVTSVDFWWSEGYFREVPENTNLAVARETLMRASALNSELVKIHDASTFQSTDCVQLYIDELAVSAGAWNYRVSRIFSSRKHHGSSSGRYIPALVVRYEEDEYQVVRPREHWQRTSGETNYQLHTVFEVLHLLSAADKEGLWYLSGHWENQ